MGILNRPLDFVDDLRFRQIDDNEAIYINQWERREVGKNAEWHRIALLTC